MRNKWTSRKFWLTVIAAVCSAIAMFGYDVSWWEVVVSDALVAVWVVVEGVIDAIKKPASSK